MASIYNYTFENLTRISNDKCGLSEKDMQNQTLQNTVHKVILKKIVE